MLTARGWWLLLFALFLAAIGTAMSLQRSALVAILGLSVLAWLTVEGCRFVFGLRWALPAVRIEREVRDDRGPTQTLWAGRGYEVVVRVHCDSRIALPFALIDDRFPFGAELVSGSSGGAGQVRRGQPAEVRYWIRCRSAGPIRFEGVRLRLADAQGFFFKHVFVRRAAEYPVLPPLVDAEAKQRHTKHDNLLPPPGIHRLHRPGGGSELLDLRDYQPGDPPKMIAWKASARRDKLITKEFESDVPVRCTLFVDASQSVRLGPPGRNALARIVEIASGTAQAALANRDHAGLVVFDEQDASYMPPARGRRHLIDLLRRLGEVGRLPPSTTWPDVATLLPIARAFAEEVYPELVDPRVNTWRWWLPIMFPRPEYLRTLTLADAVFPWWRRLSLHEWRQQAVRKRLSALLAVSENLSAGTVALMMEDDVYFGTMLQRFLARHRVPVPAPLYDWRGKYLFGSSEKIEVLAHALLRAVRRGRDNELFVLLADVFELGDRLEPLRKAVSVALGRHHRVIVICPWSPDIPMKGLGDGEPAATGVDVLATARKALIRRYQAAYENTRREFGKLAVPVICAAQREPVQLILDRMDQLRLAGIRR